MAKLGPLLLRTLERLDSMESEGAERMAIAGVGGSDEEGTLPVVACLPRIQPERGEGWMRYKERAVVALRPLLARFEDLMGTEAVPLYAGNAAQVQVTPPQVLHLQDDPGVEYVELDPLVQVTSMNDAVLDVELPTFSMRTPGIDGSGVRVAVLDSGVDELHPCLKVHDSVETCGESVAIPGSHGTHCAGIIASRDAVYPGIAPGVELLNVKVLRSNGAGRETYITRGIDEALDREAVILSMSLGFNHLPAWSQDGHGWSCPQGRCVLCSAVDTAVVADGALVVVAAGNEHQMAQALRSAGYGNTFDTELSCPGQAESAFTVGALAKGTFMPAAFSSHGPTADGRAKPDLSAPGVNVMSTVPVPRDQHGRPVPAPARHLLFGRKSGTSMATPVVAGAAALLVAKHRSQGVKLTAAALRSLLRTQGALPLPHPALEVGAGRLSLRAL